MPPLSASAYIGVMTCDRDRRRGAEV